MPCALPIAGAKHVHARRSMNSSATSRVCRTDSLSEPMPSSTPWMRLDLALDVRADRRASATTSMVCRRFSATGSVRGVEQHRVPAGREAVGDHRRGPGSGRGAGPPAPSTSRGDRVEHRHEHVRPIDRTVFTEVCTISGDRASTAAASTASMLRSLTMLMAGTPYRWASASSTRSFNDATDTFTSSHPAGCGPDQSLLYVALQKCCTKSQRRCEAVAGASIDGEGRGPMRLRGRPCKSTVRRSGGSMD